MKKIKYMLLAGALLCSAGAFAQLENTVTLKAGYSVGIPMGSTKDVINNTSWKGFDVELMYHTSQAFSIGLETGSQAYYQKFPRMIYKQSDGSDISAVISNTVQTVPIMLKGQYNFLSTKMIQPYVAVAAGGNVISYDQYAGEFSNNSKTMFNFVAKPEAGIYVPFRKYSRGGITLGAGYNFMPFNYNGISNFNNLTARIGISFPLQ